MVKHVVMWTLKDKSRAEALKDAIDAMKGKVPSLVDVESGVNYNPSDAAFDLILISVHRSKEELEAYQADPVHGQFKELISSEAVNRQVVDFEF